MSPSATRQSTTLLQEEPMRLAPLTPRTAQPRKSTYRSFSLAIGFLLVGSVAFAQQTRYVDATGVDAGDCTDIDSPCATVGFAVEQSADGDIIDIAAGAYIESVTLDKSLSLRGAGPESTSIRASTTRSLRDRVITIGPGLEVSISGVTISHGWAGSWSIPARLGGGVYIEGSVLNLTDVTLLRNKTTGGGGAGIASFNASGTYSNVIFSGNFTDSSGGKGGGLLNVGSDPVLTNVVFMGNEGELGGGMYNAASSPVLTNVTFHNNMAPLSGGGIFNSNQSSPTLFNTIVWGHLVGGDGEEIFNDKTSSIELHYSLYDDQPGDIVEGGGFEATNSLNDNPLFIGPWRGRGNLRLRDGSPAIDTGDPNTDLSLFPVNDEGVPIDLDGNPRVNGETIDIGAYEH